MHTPRLVAPFLASYWATYRDNAHKPCPMEIRSWASAASQKGPTEMRAEWKLVNQFPAIPVVFHERLWQASILTQCRTLMLAKVERRLAVKILIMFV